MTDGLVVGHKSPQELSDVATTDPSVLVVNDDDMRRALALGADRRCASTE